MAKGAHACANCQRCSRSAATAGVTALGRGTLHVSTLGVSLVASGLRRKCGVCGHQRAEHRAELVANVGVTHPAGSSADDLVRQTEHQRQLAMAQWQAQQVQLAQLAELARLGQQGSGPSAAPAAQIEATRIPSGAATGVVDQLIQLAALRDQGVLTDAEFAAAKANLLGQRDESDETYS